MSIISGDPTLWPASFESVSDADPPSAAVLNVPLEVLADRTAWVKALAPDRIPLTNFRSSVSGAFVHAVWNAVMRSWYALETTTICRQSSTAGWSWSNNLITGTDTLHKIACDASGNMVIVAGSGTGPAFVHDFAAATNTWLRHGAGTLASPNSSLEGEVGLIHDDVHGVWLIAARDDGAGNAQKSWTSTDRAAWSYRGAIGGQDNNHRGEQLAVDNVSGRIVFMARNAPIGTLDGTSRVYTSTDGVASWVAQAGFTHGVTSGTVNSLKWNAHAGEFMAVIGDAVTPSCKVFTSPDGGTWTAGAVFAAKCIRRISSIGATWVGVLTTGDLIFSTDHGATWSYVGFALDLGPNALVSSGSQLLSLHASVVWPGLVSGVGGGLVT